MAKEIHIGDIGTVFVLTIQEDGTAVDVSSATATKNIIFKKPDATTLTVAASFTTDGTDGKIEYPTVSGDINISGIWHIQGQVVLSGGTFFTDIAEFEVEKSL